VGGAAACRHQKVRKCLKMLLYKEAPWGFILKLEVGAVFENTVITNITQKNNYISISTKAGDVYNAHWKPNGFNVFVQRKALKKMRKIREMKKR
jgi:hypothetical protein